MTTDLARAVHDACHLTGEFTLRLRSGRERGYFDKYLFESDPVLLRDVADAMVALLPDGDVLGGMEMGGIPLVTVMPQITGLPAVFVRKRARSSTPGCAPSTGSRVASPGRNLPERATSLCS